MLGPGPPRAALQIGGGRGGPLGPRAGAAASAQEGPLCGSRAAAQPRGQGPGTWLADPLTVQRRPLTSVSRLESTGRRPRPFPGWRELGLLTFSRVSASSSNAPAQLLHHHPGYLLFLQERLFQWQVGPTRIIQARALITSAKSRGHVSGRLWVPPSGPHSTGGRIHPSRE